MSEDFNELFTSNYDSSFNIFTSCGVLEPILDENQIVCPVELSDFDLELLEPYDTFGLSMRKNYVKERFSYLDPKPPFKKKEEPLLLESSFTTFDRTDMGSYTPVRAQRISANDNIFEQSFKSEIVSDFSNKQNCVKVLQPIKNRQNNQTAELSKIKSLNSTLLMSKNKSKENTPNRTPLKACKCTKSKCLRLYCECFAKGMICGVDCKCSECHNNNEHKPLRELVIQETLEKNPYAFKSKYKRLDRKDSILHSRGCNCSKTGCIKEYCECFKAGTGCSRLCKCLNCQNQKIEIEADEVKMYYDRVLRKRKKKNVLKECFSNKMEILRKMSLNFN